TDAQTLLGGDYSYEIGDLQLSADNNVTLEVGADELDNLIDNASGLQGLGVDAIEDIDGNGFTISDDQASSLVDAGIEFSQFSDVTLNVDASQGDATHLSTSLKDLQKLGVDNVMLSGASDFAIGLGAGDFGAGGLPDFDSAANVTLNADISQLSELIAHAGDISAANIDQVQLSGTESELAALVSGDLDGSNVSAFTLNVTESEFDAFHSSGLPNVDGVTVDTIDVIGFSSSTAELAIDLGAANEMINAGLS
ncbi:MAG: hypothetical protein V4603_05730, partial [Pseudomonadota bacterium]